MCFGDDNYDYSAPETTETETDLLERFPVDSRVEWQEANGDSYLDFTTNEPIHGTVVGASGSDSLRVNWDRYGVQTNAARNLRLIETTETKESDVTETKQLNDGDVAIITIPEDYTEGGDYYNAFRGVKVRIVSTAPKLIPGAPAGTMLVNANEFGGRPGGDDETQEDADLINALFGLDLKLGDFFIPAEHLAKDENHRDDAVDEMTDEEFEKFLDGLFGEDDDEIEPVIQVGDIATIQPRGDEHARWVGFPVEVKEITENGNNAWVRPLLDRPDGFGQSEFFWDLDELVLGLPADEDETTVEPAEVAAGLVAVEDVTRTVEALIQEGKDYAGLTDFQESVIVDAFRSIGVELRPEVEAVEAVSDPLVDQFVVVRGRKSEVDALFAEVLDAVTERQYAGDFESIVLVDSEQDEADLDA